MDECYSGLEVGKTSADLESYLYPRLIPFLLHTVYSPLSPLCRGFLPKSSCGFWESTFSSPTGFRWSPADKRFLSWVENHASHEAAALWNFVIKIKDVGCGLAHHFLPSPPLDNIRVMVIVWRLRGNIISTAVCWIVWHNVHSQQHTYMSSSYRFNRLDLSHWDS